jgi:hypothetical protein
MGTCYSAGSYLAVYDLPAGLYTLTIVEPSAPLPQYPGCTPFTLMVHFGNATSSTLIAGAAASVSPFPTSLDSLSFLGYSRTAVLTENFVLYTDLQNVTFDLQNVILCDSSDTVAARSPGQRSVGLAINDGGRPGHQSGPGVAS